MKRLPPYWAAVLALTTTLTGLSPRNVHAGCCDHVTALEEDNQSALILEARVTGRICLKLENGSIVTDVTIQPIETFKGVNQSEPIIIRMPGGRVGKLSRHDSGFVTLNSGQDYIFRLIRHRGNWSILNAKTSKINQQSAARRNSYRKKLNQQGTRHKRHTLEPVTTAQTTDSAELAISDTGGATGSAALNYQNSSGVPTRFTVCDSGAPIEYYVDTELLPPGISEAEALQATSDALAAWSDASGLHFKFVGKIVLGKAAADVNISDSRFRIQLHNKYNRFNNNSSTLGQGGGGWTLDVGRGARVMTQEFHQRTSGYLSLNHVSTSMQNLSTFTEVLTHELGHVLGLNHSSENSSESDPYLNQATMYYRVHSDGRGASAQNYDIDQMDYGYPAANMPPSGIDRIMFAVTGNNLPSDIGLNSITVGGNDRETPGSLSLEMTSTSPFSQSGDSIIVYTPAANSNYELTEAKIEGGWYYDRIEYRISDGVNLSATHNLRVVGFRLDSTPSDGLPDKWMTDNDFEIAVGAPGDDNHPDSDPDGDGMSNRIEFIYGTDPNDPASYPPLMSYDHEAQTVSWNTINRMPYYLECSEDMSTWVKLGAFLGNGTRLTSDVTNSSNTQRFYRIKLQP